jgi:hypothetical protein
MQALFRRVPSVVVPQLASSIRTLAHNPHPQAVADEIVRFSSVLDLDGRLALAGDALSAGELGLARRLFDLGTAMPGSDDSVRARWLAFWLGHENKVAPAPTAQPTARLAVLDYRHPDLFRASVNIGDWVQTTALLGNVARLNGVTFTGDPGIAEFADRLHSRVAADDLSPAAGTLELSAIQRDVSGLDSVAERTWLIAYGWYMWPRFGETFDFPFNPNVLPIFLSFHCNDLAFLTPESEEYLRTHGPVGCRDWATVDLLSARGIPAFFSGCVTTTLGTVARRTLSESAAAPLPVAYVDLEVPAEDENVVELTQADADVLQRSVGANLTAALSLLDEYRDSFSRVRTSRLHCYLPCRAIGTPVEILPPDPSDIRFGGLLGIDDESFAHMAEGLSEKIASFLGWILAGDSPDEVYRKWGTLCAPDVAAARSRSAA